ncbi:hypothetical protein EHS25_001279 [Saitozyma podzolica]|uniref:Uncharacterized protein n=1 Tax=Saitozyma podzolica TaxID=1890683 RepID=A0A427YHW4_9TREE|nr:hypothetical protein EHS25_001279 [Saitozyma podzolica]
MRFEEPSSMVRWDSPLFTIAWDEEPPYDAIWESITKGAKAPPTAAVKMAAKPPLNTLQVLSNTTSLIVSSLLSHLSHSPNSPTFQVPSPPAGATLVLHLPMRSVTLPEMQRLKRQFERVQTAAQASGGRAAGMWKEEEVARKFVSFLEESWDT